MSSNLNKLRLPAVTIVVLLGLLAWGNIGCTDHGPVGIFSQELFNRDIGLPHLDIASASSISFTVTSYNPNTNTAGSVQYATVFLLNNGGSSTYGPVSVNFTCSDPMVIFVTPTATTSAEIGAYADTGSGVEVPASLTSFITMLRGYNFNGHDYVIATAGESFQFWYNYTGPFPGTIVHPSVIYMTIKDGIGNTWNTQYTIYITT